MPERLPLELKPSIADCRRAVMPAGMVQRYRVPEYWCLHVYAYRAKLRYRGRDLRLTPGCVTLLRPDEPMAYEFTDGGAHIYVHFSHPGARRTGEHVVMPTLFDLDDRFAEYWDRFEQLAVFHASSALRAEVSLWDLLWDLHDMQRTVRPRQSAGRRALERVRVAIELGLGGPLRVQALAREAELSHNQLTRLFQERLGTTVIGWIRRRRAERAKHLLRHTTLPIKHVAIEVGLPDLQQFNKTLRRELGAGPRAIRAGDLRS